MPSSEIKFADDEDENKSEGEDGFERDFSLVDLPPDLAPIKNPNLKKSKTNHSLGNSLGNSQNKTEFDSNKADSAEQASSKSTGKIKI